MPCQLDEKELQKRKAKIQELILKVKLKPFEKDIIKANDRIYLRFRVKQAIKILEFAQKMFRGKLAFAFSGGKDSLVSLHLALQTIGKDTPIIYNHTTVEFPETVKYVTWLANEWKLNLIIAKPEISFFSMVKQMGWASHENRWCCRTHKDSPAHEIMAQEGIIAEVTGTTRTESVYRRSLRPFMLPKREPAIIRIHPLYDWNQWEVWRYIKDKNLPYNPLYDIGYQRIGCWCCPINGKSHYKRLQKTHKKLYDFLNAFQPTHPIIARLNGQEVYINNT
jgi:phosphoadenosine phosphosulfate reductase